jgi:hypothetical protein
MPGKVMWGVLIALLVGCEDRERLVFDPVPVDHEGPISHIDPPSRDTTLLEGDAFVIGGLSVDPSGVDTLYIEVEGANLSYLPLDGEGRDTLHFAITLPTQGLRGRTITVGVHGVDVIGNVGPTLTRRFTIDAIE